MLAIAGLSFVAQANNDALLEACNAVPDAAKRLECFRQATGKQSADKAVSYAALRDSLVALDGQLNQGISLINYNQAILSPAKELALFERSNPNSNSQAIGALRAAMQAYNDASRFWSASIAVGVKNRGIFTSSTMTFDDMTTQGISDLVGKYSFPIVPAGPFGAWKGVRRFDGLSTIWAVARKAQEEAFQILDGKMTPASGGMTPEEDDGTPASPTKACAQDVIDRLRESGHREPQIKRTCGVALRWSSG